MLKFLEVNVEPLEFSFIHDNVNKHDTYVLIRIKIFTAAKNFVEPKD